MAAQPAPMHANMPTSICHVPQAVKAIASQHGARPAAAAPGAGSLASEGGAPITDDPAPVAKTSHAGACWAGVQWSQQLAAQPC
jgi:hypothetical protein